MSGKAPNPYKVGHAAWQRWAAERRKKLADQARRRRLDTQFGKLKTKSVADRRRRYEIFRKALMARLSKDYGKTKVEFGLHPAIKTLLNRESLSMEQMARLSAWMARERLPKNFREMLFYSHYDAPRSIEGKKQLPINHELDRFTVLEEDFMGSEHPSLKWDTMLSPMSDTAREENGMTGLFHDWQYVTAPWNYKYIRYRPEVKPANRGRRTMFFRNRLSGSKPYSGPRLNYRYRRAGELDDAPKYRQPIRRSTFGQKESLYYKTWGHDWRATKISTWDSHLVGRHAHPWRK